MDNPEYKIRELQQKIEELEQKIARDSEDIWHYMHYLSKALNLFRRERKKNA